MHAAIKALVVDDDPLILPLLVAFLSARGYAVDQATDGESALSRLRAAPDYDLVITDRHMPRMDGLALCRALRELPSASYTYCIMLTGMGDEESLVAAMEAGVDDFLAKPLSLPELGARLRAAERVLRLQSDLASRNRKLEDAYGQLSRELGLARALQLGQLPAPSSYGRLHFDSLFEASSYVGGDSFDCFLLDERHACFYVIDVSGHGVAAAMMAFNAQHQLHAAAQQVGLARLRAGHGPGAAAVAAVETFNERFLQMKESSFYLTLVFGIVALDSGAAAFVQAGHPPPLLSASASEPFVPLGDGGVPVGILAAPGYEAVSMQLAAGARLVVHSDGITDCRNPADEAFGDLRLRAALDAARAQPLHALGPALNAQLHAWHAGDGYEDDVTLLVLELA